MDLFSVLTPGAYTTVQDGGRYGFQQMGIPVSGALDSFAFQTANMLVGNPAGHAVLEITIIGPRLEMLAEADLAVTGARMGMMLNDRPVQGWQSFRVKPGDVLDIGQVKSGCRAYLAVSGGIEVAEVMGSRSTYVGGRIGGYHGRPLKQGDILAVGKAVLQSGNRQLPEQWVPDYSADIVLRAVIGPQDDFFTDGLAILFESEFMVSTKADRMGYRLQGAGIIHREGVPKSIISEPSMPGGIQIPADQQPIVLLVEQTVGGYTKIATVISTDLTRVAQATPGDPVRFEQVTLETAHSLYRENQRLMQQIDDYLMKI